jgi:hypothetical protein
VGSIRICGWVVTLRFCCVSLAEKVPFTSAYPLYDFYQIFVFFILLILS